MFIIMFLIIKSFKEYDKLMTKTDRKQRTI